MAGGAQTVVKNRLYISTCIGPAAPILAGRKCSVNKNIIISHGTCDDSRERGRGTFLPGKGGLVRSRFPFLIPNAAKYNCTGISRRGHTSPVRFLAQQTATVGGDAASAGGGG